MKKIYLLLFTFFLITLKVSAQNQHELDSMENLLLTAKTDTDRLNHAFNLAITYSATNPQKAIERANIVLQVAEKTQDKASLGHAYDALADIEFNRGNHLKSLEYYRKSLEYRELAGNKQYVAYTYNNIGTVFFHLGNLPEAVKNYFSALKVYEAMNDKETMEGSYTNIGILYNDSGNYPEAIKNFEAALKISQELNFKVGIARYYQNMGNVYGNQKNHAESIKFHETSLKLMQELKRDKSAAIELTSIGVEYKALGDYTKALNNFLLAVKTFEKIEDKVTIALAYNNIGDIYGKQKNYDAAYRYLNKGLGLAKESKYLEGIRMSYDYLSTVDSLSGNYKEGLTHYKLFTLYRDSLYSNANTQKVMQQQFQYDFDKKEAALKYEQQLTQEQLKQQKTLTTALIIGLVAFLLATALWYQRQKQKQLQKQAAIQAEFTQQLIQTTEDERGRIAIDLHDSISHELLSLKRGLKPEYTEGVAQKIDAIIDDIRQISRNLHPVLLDKIGLKLSIETLCEQYGEHETLFITHDIDYDKPLPKPAELQVFRIIQEALNNTVKYAQANASNITMLHNTEGIVLEIKDNGKGFDVQKALQSGKSFGLHSIIQRTKAIGGKAHIQSSESGTTITITIPNS